MPYIDIAHGGDYASIWYVTNSPSGYVSSFNPDKPTIIMLHPFFLDSSWLDAQFGDPRISHHYNLIAFDARAAGKTISRPNGRQDAWTDAADLAYACHALWLPPAHVWASETIGANMAIRFAALFPDMCLSLTMLSVPSPTELEAFFHTCDELLHMWAHAEDIDTLEFTLMQVVAYIVGPDLDMDFADEIIAYLETSYPPFKRAILAQLGNVLMNREALTERELAAVTQPVLLIHGDKNQIHPIQYAERMAANLVNAEGGAKLFVVKGGQGYISVVPSWASISNQVFVKFLSRLPHARSELRPPTQSLDDRMIHALDVLAHLAADPSIARRADSEDISPMLFSRISREVQHLQVENYMSAARDQRKAFSPLGADGRPMRKYSERKHDHWFQGDRFWMSYAENWRDGDSDDEDHQHDAQHVGGPALEGADQPASQEVMRASAVHRAMFNPGTVERMDKYVVKSNLSRVASATAIPLGKLIIRS
ncbi:alpha/beta-hydrolase [Artomyces pyxidatus]|uniref:Alpha/beta-hydrolase n=1 Tax=Artomyces pyxidatus TaxID=48021 RepID=A0ACB8TJI8_9AGAM|nr:alpha/beta-hydrolase [Artomyces pyxidatus]